MPLSFHCTSAQMITEENESKQRLAFITLHSSDLEVLGYAHAVYDQLADEPRQQQRMRNNIPTEGDRSGPWLPQQ